jgi:hypothetical protein
MLGPDPALLCPQWGNPVMFSMDLRSHESCAYAVVALREERLTMTATASPAALVRHAPRPPTAGGISG